MCFFFLFSLLWEIKYVQRDYDSIPVLLHSLSTISLNVQNFYTFVIEFLCPPFFLQKTKHLLLHVQHLSAVWFDFYFCAPIRTTLHMHVWTHRLTQLLNANGGILFKTHYGFNHDNVNEY